MSTGTIPRMTYPDADRLSLWQTNIDDRDRLQIVNSDDFPRDEVLESLDLKGSSLSRSFGITDEAELRARHALGQMLLSDGDFMEWADNQTSSTGVDLPTREAEFLDYFDPLLEHNPFWAKVHRLLAFVDNTDNPPERLRQVADKLREGLPLEAMETAMAEDIRQRLQMITTIEGMMKLRISVDAEKPPKKKKGEEEAPQPKQPKWCVGIDCINHQSQVYGHRMYSQDLSSVRMAYYPDWTELRLAGLWSLGISKVVQWWVDVDNWKRRRKAYGQMVITTVSRAMELDIAAAIRRRLDMVGVNYSFNNSEITVSFIYNKDGLKVQFLDIQAAKKNVSDEQREKIGTDHFGGYSAQQREQIKQARLRRLEAQLELARCRESDTLRGQLGRSGKGAFGTMTNAPSPNMDTEYIWFAISNEYHGDYDKLYEALREYRRFFLNHKWRLQAVAELVGKVADKGKELGVPVCSPSISANGHVVDFEQLYPTHLLFRLEEGQVVPIRELPELNGQMVGLTGRHGGGKTETEVSVAVNLYLVQSGVPVFGQRWRSNVKKAIGVLFIPQRGDGSTCEKLLAKINEILDSVRKFEGREVVLVLDELGSATQEVDGLKLGKDVLQALGQRKVSVMFSTQILSLAEYAQDELGAVCFQFDRNHRITPGIGDGGMTALREKTGLDKRLAKLN